MTTAKLRTAAARDTLHLPFRIPPKDWFVLREAGSVLGVSESFAEKLYDLGHITGHSHNAGRGERHHKRVLRPSLVAYAIRTADYDDDSLADAFVGCLAHLSKPTLLRVAEEARKRALQ